MKRVVAALCAFFWCITAFAAEPGVVVANTGGKGTALFDQWQAFRHNVDEKSRGSIPLDYLIFGETGNAAAMLQAVETGKAQIASLNCQGIVSAFPELGVPQLPYLFSSAAEADYVFDHDLSPLFAPIFDAKGLVLLQWQDMGWLDIYAKTPLDGPAALSGREVRSVSNPVMYTYLQSVGAHPVPLTLNDLSTPAQADKIFASLGNVTLFALRAQPVFKYYIKNHLSFTCGAIVANKSWFQSLSPAEQAIVRGAFMSRAAARKAQEADDEQTYDQLAQKGTMVMEPTPAQYNAWAAAGLPLYPQILTGLGGAAPEVYEAVKRGKQEFLSQSGP
jgi:TRAP-type C4-dicarboxylate transport system substrate-binding protein